MVDFLERLRPGIFIETLLVVPAVCEPNPWGLIRNVEIRLLEQRLEERNTFQGARYVTPKENAGPCSR